MKSNKYSLYELVIETEKEVKTLYSMTDYQKMLKSYKDAKNKYKNENYTIYVYGKGFLGGKNVIWKKVNNVEKKNKDANSNDNFKAIFNDFVESAEKRIRYCEIYSSILEKEKSNVLHKIEGVELNDWGNEEELNKEKLSLINELIPILKERRSVKKDMAFVNDIGKILNNVKKIEKDIDSVYAKTEDLTYNIIKNKKTNIVAQKEYDTESEKHTIVNRFKKDYGVVSVDVDNHIVYGYNKCIRL